MSQDASLSDVCEQFLSSVLLADAGVAAIVAGRIWPDQAEKDAPYPFVIFKRVPSARYGDNIVAMGHTIVGAQYVYRVTCDSQSDSKDEAIAGARAIKKVLSSVNSVIFGSAQNEIDSQQLREYSGPWFDGARRYQREGGEFLLTISGG